MDRMEQAGEYEKRRRELFAHLLKHSFLVLGSLVTVASSAVDYFLAPDFIWTIFACRLASLPVALASGYAYKLAFIRESYASWPAYFSCAYFGLLHLYLFQKTGFERSPYLIGLVLATVSMIGTLPWRRREVPVALLLLWSPLLAYLPFVYMDLNASYLFADASMIVIATMLAFRIYADAEELRLRDFSSMNALEAKTRDQEKVIQEKTREAIDLEKLASQFSPQVLASVKSGALDLDAKLRLEVACIFVDVEKSTVRAQRIDHECYSSLLAHFFSECVKVFLKNDVTIGTYQGDGILAFTNAPNSNPKFREHALMASLEVLAMHARVKDFYLERWRTDFNIRIGIASGWSTVGFFPSREHGTYTVLGDSVNLASRLCSLAPANTIASTGDYLTKMELADNILEITALGRKSDIRGFEGESLEVFSLKPELESIVAAPGCCKSCGCSMEVVGSQKGGQFLKCPTCNYRVIQEMGNENREKKRVA